MGAIRRHGWLLPAFGLAAILANGAIILILRQHPSTLVTAASCADLLVTLPALYYFLLVRTGVQPLIMMLPVVLGGLLRVSYIAPVNGAGKLVLATVCEAGLVWFLMRRGRNGLLARVLLSELSIFYFALNWWARPDVPPGARPFSMHRRNGTALIFRMFAGLSLIEAACAHLVVQHWSPKAAWWLTGLSIYGAMLLVALARSFRLRPMLLTEDRLILRAGMLWKVEVPRGMITSVETPSHGWKGNGLRITGLGSPNVILELSTPVEAEGLYGRRKRAARITISADDPAELIRAL